MKAVLDKSKESVKDLVAKNSVLVAENSKLRMHLSLMPVQYRDFAAHHQQTNSTLYQDHRRDPKVIIPRSTHLKGGEIICAPAPMSHPSVQEYMCDAVYTTLGQSKAAFDQVFKLKKRITEDKDTKRIPLKSTAVTQINVISSTGPTEFTRTSDNRIFEVESSEPPPSHNNNDRSNRAPLERSHNRSNRLSEPPAQSNRDWGNNGSRERSPSWGKGKRHNEESRNAPSKYSRNDPSHDWGSSRGKGKFSSSAASRSKCRVFATHFFR